ncbi:MAG: pyridoxal 5'-phosphate synthase glutaminase subunit PdxT [Nocardioidaceae bacterium]
MLADHIKDGMAGQETFGGLDVTVRRNAFGRQVDSFETDLDFVGLDDPVHAVFIRAPWVDEVGAGVRVLARVDGGPSDDKVVAVQQEQLMATSFHPEVDDDERVHRMFVDLVRQNA